MASKTGASFQDLASAFKRGEFQPLYFLFGDEGFPMDELQAILIEHALRPEEHDFNLDIAFGPESTTPDVLARCAALPMMAERRVVVVRGFDAMDEKQPSRKQQFKEYAERPNPNTVVLLLCNKKPNLRQNPYVALKKHAVWGEFKTLYDDKLPGWIDRRLKANGFTAEGGVSQMVADAVGPDLRTTANELDKLIAYAGDAKTLTEEDVVRAAGQSREASVFELQKAVGLRDHRRSQFIADQLLSAATNRAGEALMIVSMLARYFTKLWRLTACLQKGMSRSDMAGQIGVHPYFVGEYERAARTFSPISIQTALAALLAADMELKGGSQRDPRLILTLMLGKMRPSETSV